MKTHFSKILLSAIFVASALGTSAIASTEKNSNQGNSGEASGLSSNNGVQESFIDNLVKENISVSIYLVNGIKLQGFIDSQDNSVIVLRNNVSQIVYKNAISTIVPSR